MRLMSHPDPEVQKRALLCVQKIMLPRDKLDFLAAATAAVIYAFHCFDDSPLFVLTWYSLAAIPVVLLGAALGRRLLRW